MPLDLETLSDVIALAVNEAVAPFKAQQAVTDAKLLELSELRETVAGLRERVAVAETKAAVLPQPAPSDGMVERTAALEVKCAELGSSRSAVDDLARRVDALEQRPAPVPVVPDVEDVAVLRDRVTVIETKAAGFEARFSQPDPLGSLLAKTDVDLQMLARDVGALRERVAVVEVRAQQPGPPGKDGKDGKDGADGKDGTAGLSFEGVYQEGQAYTKGALVTWAGSSWHCNEPTTTKPGDGSKDWTLMVKRGRDGKDGKDAALLPVVSVGARG